MGRGQDPAPDGTPVGRTRDAGWQIGVSRTVAYPLEVVWRALVSAEGREVWLGPGGHLEPAPGAGYATEDGVSGEVRSWRPRDRVRLTHRRPDATHETTVQFALTAAAPDRTTIRVHEERLRDADEREAQRAHWRTVVDRLETMLDAG